jgi:putative Mn2+ efflux pump MntP
MSAATIIFIALGLAMDAFAVSVACGVTLKLQRMRNAFRIAFFFGFFQMIMPVLGWLAGRGIRTAISSFDHWVAFGLLLLVGIKMIYESARMERDKRETEHLSISVLLMLALATSIDALAVGLGFAFLNVAIVTPVIVIGAVTFALSFSGVFLGHLVGHVFERRIEVLGGLVLIAIGIKILIQHLA